EFWGRMSWIPRASEPLSLEADGRDTADALTLISREPVGSSARARHGARSGWEADHLDPSSHAGSPVASLAFSWDGGVLASRRLGGPLLVWDARRGELLDGLKLGPFESDVHCPFAFSPSTPARLVVGVNAPLPGREHPYAVVLWDRDVVASEDSPNVFAIRWTPAPIRLLCLPARGSAVLFVDEEDTACDLVRGSFFGALVNRSQPAYECGSVTRLGYRAEALGVSPDGRYRATGDDRGVVRLYREGFGERVFAERAHGSQVTAVAFAGARYFATAGRDREVVLWDVKNRGVLKRLDEHRQAVRWVLFSEDRDTMVSADVSGEIKVWDCGRRLALRETIQADGFSLTALAMSPDGRLIASATDRNRIQLWRRARSRRRRDDEDDE
ncbi:MAG TPA: hypothetical protein VF586_04470, partial [Pyrinomonadaceae bacterium]